MEFFTLGHVQQWNGQNRRTKKNALEWDVIILTEMIVKHSPLQEVPLGGTHPTCIEIDTLG